MNPVLAKNEKRSILNLVFKWPSLQDAALAVNFTVSLPRDTQAGFYCWKTSSTLAVLLLLPLLPRRPSELLPQRMLHGLLRLHHSLSFWLWCSLCLSAMGAVLVASGLTSGAFTVLWSLWASWNT